jgi:glycosyltransferase involved in cell wall biosynthesis
MLVNSYPTSVGFKRVEEDFFLTPASVMKKKGYECEFVTLRAQGKKTIETTMGDDTAAVEYYKGFRVSRFDSPFTLLNHIRKSKAILQSNLRPWPPTSFSAFLPNTKAIRSFTYFMGSNLPISLFSALMFRRFNLILTVTPFEGQVYRKYKIPASKIRHIPLEIDYKFYSRKVNADDVMKKFGIKSKDKLIVGVANFRRLKKFDDLLKALTIVKKSVPNAKVILVGLDMLHLQGLPSLKETAARLGISDSVIVTGWQPPEVLRKVYSISSVFCHPAADEYQGLVSYEAAAMGLPLCLSSIGSHTSVFREHALYHNVNDFEKLAENIVVSIKNSEKREQHVKFLRSYMKEWDHPVIFKRLSKFYDELIDINSTRA